MVYRRSFVPAAWRKPPRRARNNLCCVIPHHVATLALASWRTKQYAFIPLPAAAEFRGSTVLADPCDAGDLHESVSLPAGTAVSRRGRVGVSRRGEVGGRRAALPAC